jgi:hypothetical protein
LLERERYKRRDKLPIEGERVPVMPLPFNCHKVIAVAEKTEEGIVPTKEFCDSISWLRVEGTLGIVPLRRFPPKLSHLSRERLIRLSGIVPTIDVEINLIMISAVNEVMEGGIVPPMDNVSSSILLITPDEQDKPVKLHRFEIVPESQVQEAALPTFEEEIRSQIKVFSRSR